MSINLTVGTRVRFIAHLVHRQPWTDQVGVIIDKNSWPSSYNYRLEDNIVLVYFDNLILGKRTHFCSISYLELEQRTPEEEDRIRRETHAMKYL